MQLPGKQSVVFYSWRVPWNWSSVPLPTFLATKINKEKQQHQKIFFMKGISTMVGMHNWHVSVKHFKHRGMIVSLLFITCKQLISISFENFCILTLEEKHFSWTLKIKDISFSMRTGAWENFNHYNIMKAPILTVLVSLVTYTEFLLTLSVQYQADKWWE